MTGKKPGSRHGRSLIPLWRQFGRHTHACVLAAALATCVTAANAEENPSRSLMGTPGYTDMPSAFMPPRDTLGLNLSTRGGSRQASLDFQITDRLGGTFRYGYLEGQSTGLAANYDRSFDLRYQLLREGRRLPAVTVGMTDFLGTGILSSEYLVASKHLGERFTVTGGIGWGRLGTHHGFKNPLSFLGSALETRKPTADSSAGAGATGGQVELGRLFSGDAALFAGIDWRATDRLTLSAEYSSDAYDLERDRTGYQQKTPFNFSAKYALRNGDQIGLHSFYGTQFALSYSHALAPGRPRLPSGLDTAPPPIQPRPVVDMAAWQGAVFASAGRAVPVDLVAALRGQGLLVQGVAVEGRAATVTVENAAWGASAQAVGRAARVMANHLPSQVETLHIRLARSGMEISEVTLQRADLERYENMPGGAQAMAARSIIQQPGRALAPMPGVFPNTRFGLSPYLAPSYFDPDKPVRLDLGFQARLDYQLAPGITLSTQLRKRVVGNRGPTRFAANSALPHVRTDSGLFDQNADPEISHLTAEYLFRPGADLFGRITAGHLERMYGGLSAELLWQPTDSRLALGAELNYARKRDYNSILGFDDYDVITGHASVYYDIGNGFVSRVDAGRYLAGDWGGTFTLERRFNNGFRIGAFVTLTDVSAADFGEGSFDKGITLRIPLDWVSGKPSRVAGNIILRPVQRDGGARLDVQGRLYDRIADDQALTLNNRWGRFWR
ncbi:YjbH domain-containing protein [Phaeovulum sp.]|uniref:YjbH domain-containing protein n=1 Tax=Phaeovulum sp. TaxID=2934796 RepID=UPI0039E58453